MADKAVLLNAYIEFDSIEYSDEVESIDLSPDQNNPNTTTFGDAGVSTFEPGLQTNNMSIGAIFNANLGTGLHAFLRANAGTKVTCKVRKSQDAIATSNPEATFTVIVPPIGLAASVGDTFKKNLNFQVTGAITWATS